MGDCGSDGGLNPFSAEEYPLIATIGGLQDWAGVFHFAYRGNGETAQWLAHPSHRISNLHCKTLSLWPAQEQLGPTLVPADEAEYSTKLVTAVAMSRVWQRHDVYAGLEGDALVVVRNHSAMLDEAIGYCGVRLVCFGIAVRSWLG